MKKGHELTLAGGLMIGGALFAGFVGGPASENVENCLAAENSVSAECIDTNVTTNELWKFGGAVMLGSMVVGAGFNSAIRHL